METDNICIICFEEFSEKSDIYKLDECGHSFHSNCIIKWFRNNHSECPYCKSIPKYDNSFLFNRFDRKAKIKYLYMYIKKNENVPKDLIKISNKLTKIKQAFDEKKQKYNDFIKNNDNKEFIEKLKIYKKLRKDARSWKAQSKIQEIESEMATYPLLPILVKIKK